MNASVRLRPAQRKLHIVPGLVLGAYALLLSPASLAAVYQCADASGGVIFTDQACPDKAAGAIVEVASANIDYGYDRRAASKVRSRATEQANQFRRGWQTHNAQMSKLADKPERRRLSQYRSSKEPIPKPRSKRKQKNPYKVTRGY